jgi:Na+/H+-dicarboxylate symporter
MAKVNPVSSAPKLSVTREIAIGIGLGIACAMVFRQWNLGYMETIRKYYRELEEQEQSSSSS